MWSFTPHRFEALFSILRYLSLHLCYQSFWMMTFSTLLKTKCNVQLYPRFRAQQKCCNKYVPSWIVWSKQPNNEKLNRTLATLITCVVQHRARPQRNSRQWHMCWVNKNPKNRTRTFELVRLLRTERGPQVICQNSFDIPIVCARVCVWLLLTKRHAWRRAEREREYGTPRLCRACKLWRRRVVDAVRSLATDCTSTSTSSGTMCQSGNCD